MNFWVVMPVYNEEEAITKVINDWLKVLRKNLSSFTFCILNDGSKDNTLHLINAIALKEKELLIIDKTNSGHGQTCIHGYKMAIAKGAEWIIQIDSDGQCDPEFFPKFLKETSNHKVIYGFRKTRADGLKRLIISRIVSVFTLLATSVWVRDANVPYRLMHQSTLQNYLEKIPSEFYLANILVSVIHKKHFSIKWINIHFLNRAGGTTNDKAYSFAVHGLKLFKQLRHFSKAT